MSMTTKSAEGEDIRYMWMLL